MSGLPSLTGAFAGDTDGKMDDESMAWLCRVISFRDAQQRTLMFDAESEALEHFRGARASGDDIMAAALLVRASVRGWSTLLAACDETTRHELESLTKFPQRAGGSHG